MSLLRGLACLLVVGGCDQVFGLDGRVEHDGSIPADVMEMPDARPPCNMGAFGVREPLSESSTSMVDPSQRGDLNELFFAEPDGNYELFHMTRASPAIKYSDRVKLAAVNTTYNETDPAITADGLDLFFKSDRPTGFGPAYVWEATRPNTTVDFDSPHQAAGLEGVAINGLDISSDGLTIYIVSGGQLSSLRRPDRGARFDDSAPLADSIDYPAISHDGLELFYSTSGVSRRHRDDLVSTFGPEEIVDAGGQDPDISDDGTTLIIVTGTGLAVRRRSCL